MNVIRNFEKIVIFFIVSLLILNCNKKDKVEEKETYKILSLIINEYTGINGAILPPPPPYPQNKYILKEGLKGKWISTEDSLVYYKNYEEILTKAKKDLINKKFTIAIVPTLNTYSKEIKLDTLINEYKNLANKLTSFEEKRIININRIKNKISKNIILTETALNRNSIKENDSDLFDHCVNFSRLVFNDNFSKALVIFSFSRSGLDGYSTLIYLEKNDGKWKEKYNQILSIS